MPRFTEVLNSLLRIDNLDIYVTGSNSRFLSSDIVTEFRGRGDELHLFPLSFEEFYSVFDGDFDDALSDYLIYGGLPAITRLKTNRQKAEHLKKNFANVYLQDVIERNNLKSDSEIAILVDILASTIGAPTNPTKIANTFQSKRIKAYTNKTVSNHISYLEDSFLISKAHRYDVKGRKYIGSNLKYYFTDLGLRNARLNFRQQEITHLLENLVYNELRIRGFNIDVGIVEINTKTPEGKSQRKQLEVDFIANLASTRYYIQVAYKIDEDQKKEQELKSLKNISDSFKKILLIYENSNPWYNEDGILIMGIKYFLLNKKCFEFN